MNKLHLEALLFKHKSGEKPPAPQFTGGGGGEKGESNFYQTLSVFSVFLISTTELFPFLAKIDSLVLCIKDLSSFWSEAIAQTEHMALHSKALRFNPLVKDLM